MNTRQCDTCVYYAPGTSGFLPGSESFTGRCLHPRRQLPCEPQPWVRGRELPCRLEWDRDLWKQDEGDDDQVLDVRMLDPRRPRPGPNGPTRNLLQCLLILSDRHSLPELREDWDWVGLEIGRDYVVDGAPTGPTPDFHAWPWAIDLIQLVRRHHE